MALTRRTLLRAAPALPLASLAGLSARPALSAPAATATATGAGTVQDGRWRDDARQRDIPWRLRLPAGEGPVPLVLFSHGLGGSLDGGTEWAQAWAAAGIATLHLQHAGSDRAIWSTGLRGVRQAATPQQLQARVQDVQFAVAQLDGASRAGAANAALWRRIRTDALALSGHSFGAQTTLAVAAGWQGGRPNGAGREAAASPFKAFAAFSPSVGRQQQRLAGVTTPFLCLTGSLDGNPLGDEKDGDYRRAVYDALPAGQKAELWLEGADHMSFGGGGERGAGLGQRLMGRRRPQVPEALAAHHAALITAVTTDWWRAHLLADAAALARLRQPQGLGQGDEWRRG